MTHSMTGFGKASRDFDGETVSVELSTVNHRYLDCSVRLPAAWAAVEPAIKQAVRERLARGKAHVNVNRKRASVTRQQVHFDPGLARQYIEASKELSHILGTYETLSLNVLAQLEGVFYLSDPEENLEEISAFLVSLVGEAIERLEGMRRTEGAALCEDLRRRVAVLREALAGIEGRLPELNRAYEERLRARVLELNADAKLTEDRVALEVALMGDKADVTEEVVRLKSHLGHMLELLEDDGAVGRQLDFLTQEIQREVNTLGVKTRDAEVAKDVLWMKSEVERIREQVQNIE